MTSNLTRHLQAVNTHSLSVQDYELRLYRSTDQLPKDWNSVAPADNLLLHTDYLNVLEKAPAKQMRMIYLIFYKAGEPVGITYCQLQHFKADKSINREEDKKSPCFFRVFARFMRGFVSSIIEFNTLVVGNLLFTGENGVYFKDKVPTQLHLPLVEEGVKKVQEQLASEKLSVSVVLYKDYFEKNKPAMKPLTDGGYNEFTIQPSMIMQVNPEWNTFEDYMAAITSKYRVKCKSVLKKSKDLTCQCFSLKDIENRNDRIYELYQEVALESGFNVIQLHPDYFYQLKKQLGERFQLYAFFLEEKMVAFYTTIENHDELEAHFLGFDQKLNREHRIYHFTLFELIRRGIEQKMKTIQFARTALEIKSSVGAVPFEMYCYLRHRNSFSNQFLQPILDYLRPDAGEWKPRHPFK